MAYSYVPKVLGIQLITSSIGSLICKDSNGADFPGLTLKFFDANGDEVSDSANEGSIVKTVLDFEPTTFGYAFRGGEFYTNGVIDKPCYIFFVIAPDVPVEAGGSVEMVSCINLQFVTIGSSYDQGVDDDFAQTYLRYDANTHAGKSRLILKHEIGRKYDLHFVAKLKLELGTP